MRVGYRSCICGTEECFQAMSQYVEQVHDKSDPTKYFPWLYVDIPKMPKPEDEHSRSSMRPERVLKRQVKRKCRLLFCRHLRLKQDADYTGKKEDNLVRHQDFWVTHQDFEMTSRFFKLHTKIFLDVFTMF